MKHDDALDVLRSHRSQLSALGIDGLYLHAADETDVELIVDMNAGRCPFFDLMCVQDACIAILGMRVETHHLGAYLRRAGSRNRAGRDLIRVF